MKLIHKISFWTLCLSITFTPINSAIVSADTPYIWDSGKITVAEIVDSGTNYDDHGMFDSLAPKGIDHKIQINTSKEDGSYALYLVYQVGSDMTYQQMYFDHDVLYYNSVVDTNSVLKYLDSEYKEYSFDVKNINGASYFEAKKEPDFKQKLEIATKLYIKFGIIPETSIYENAITVPIDVWSSGGFSAKELSSSGETLNDIGLLKTFAPKDTAYEIRYYTFENNDRSALFMVYSFDGFTTYQQIEINDNDLIYLKRDPVSGKENDLDPVKEYVAKTYNYKMNETDNHISFTAELSLTPKEKMCAAADIFEKYSVIPEISIYENSLSLPIKGNVNGDKKIDVTDIAVMASHIKGISPLTDEQQYAADIDGNNELTVTDIALIASHIKGIKPL